MGIVNDPTSGWHITLYVILFITPTIICFGLLSKLVFDFAQNTKSAKKIQIKLKALSIAALSSFICTLICYFIADGFQYNIFWAHESYAMVSFFWGHGNAFAYLLFIERIKTAFGKTKFNPNQKVYAYFYVMIASVYFCQMYIVLFLFLMFEGAIIADVALMHINIVNGTEILIQLILSMSLITVFVKKLNAIIKIQNTDSNQNVRRVSGVQLDKEQNKFIQLVTKQTVLSTFAACSTCGWLIAAGIMDIDWVFYPNSPVRTKHILHFNTAIFLMNDCFVNALAVFLSFPSYKGYYDKICSKCHVCCMEVCEKHTRHQVLKLSSMSRVQTPTIEI